ncbi:MAG: hypothetical protein AAF399_11940 [Bacteroidota bacterium]
MNGKTLMLIFALGSLGSLLQGQQLSLQISAMSPDSVMSFTQQIQPSTESLDSPLFSTNPSPAFLPTYARQNPSGYSFLCLKELEIENKLPIGLWIKLENPAYLRQQLGNQASLRLKLLRF